MAFHPFQEVQQQQLHWLHLELNGWVGGICFNFTKFVVPFPLDVSFLLRDFMRKKVNMWWTMVDHPGNNCAKHW